MDTPDSGEDKYSSIRQTIRQVVLPLVQGIYDENPSDILSFCHGYFENLLRKRESSAKNDSNLEKVEDVSHGDENDVKSKSKAGQSKIVECSSSSVQGSASVPHLVSDKQSKVSNLRETSSWDLPSNHQSARARTVLDCNLADAKCGIGDQPRLEVNETGLEYDGKLGDANIRLKEDSVCKDYNPKSDLIVDEVEKPSAPPCEDTEENFIEASTEFEEEKFSDASDILKTDVSICNVTDQYTGGLDQCDGEKNETKTHNKQLSPNSSFGFIPQLNEYSSEEEQKIDDEFSGNLQMKANVENEEFTKRISETFQGLAQEFSSAETNFNAEFQNAKEISDVIQGCGSRDENSHIGPEGILGTYNDSMKRRNESSLKKPDHFKDENNNLADKGNDNVGNFNKTMDSVKREHSFNEEKHVVDNDTKELSKSESSEIEESSSQQEKSFGREKCESNNVDKNDDSKKSDSFESYTNVDESWRQRWYEVHPHLDNFSSNCRRTDPRMNRSHRGFVGNCRRPNIGEAGDVLPDAFYIQGDIPNLENPMQSNNEIPSESSSLARNCNNMPVFPSDETDHKANRGPTNGSFPKREMTNTNISSPNIPYAWRKMCRQQQCSSESGVVKKFKETKSKQDEETLDPENRKKEENVCEKYDHEKLTEIVVVKEAKENSYEFLNDNQAVTYSETDKSKENTSKIIQHKGGSKEDITSVEYTDDKDSRITNTQQESSLRKSLGFKTVTSGFKNQTDGCLHEENGSMDDHYETAENEKSSGKNIVGAKGGNCNDISSKTEPGLNSACGDFVSSVMNQNNGEDLVTQASVREAEENTRSVESNDQNDSVGGISNEYFEEIIGRVVDQQKEATNETFECLNFSSYSESDTSTAESSDFSEPEDFQVNSIGEH